MKGCHEAPFGSFEPLTPAEEAEALHKYGIRTFDDLPPGTLVFEGLEAYFEYQLQELEQNGTPAPAALKEEIRTVLEERRSAAEARRRRSG